MMVSTLGWSFFGLSSNHSKFLLDEFYYLAKYLRTSYNEFLKLPTYIRKYLLDKIIEENTPKT
jgi:hypothetical protein